ncbi:protein EVI2A [Lissotriton helveticus]
MKLVEQCYSHLMFFVGALSWLSNMNHAANYTTITSSLYVKHGNWSLTTTETESSAVVTSNMSTLKKAFLGNKSLTTSKTRRFPFLSISSTATTGKNAFSNASTSKTGNNLLSNKSMATLNATSATSPATTGDHQRTLTSNGKTGVTNSSDCKETQRGTLLISIIIIAILVLLCTFLLIATIVLANQVSKLKNVAQSKRPTRNNGDFLTISSSLWPGGSDKWKSSQLLTGANLSMDDLSIDDATTSRGQKVKEGTIEKITEQNGESKKEYELEKNTNPSSQDNDMGQMLNEDLKC